MSNHEHAVDVEHKEHSIDPEHRNHALDAEHQDHAVDVEHQNHAVDAEHKDNYEVVDLTCDCDTEVRFVGASCAYCRNCISPFSKTIVDIEFLLFIFKVLLSKIYLI